MVTAGRYSIDQTFGITNMTTTDELFRQKVKEFLALKRNSQSHSAENQQTQSPDTTVQAADQSNKQAVETETEEHFKQRDLEQPRNDS